MKEKILGVVGGLGPESSCNFCLNVNRKFKASKKVQPHVLLDNIPVSLEAEREIINGGSTKEHFDLIKESVERLNRLKADFIVIPCNTVHVFIEELREISDVPILSIIELTSEKCKELNLKKAGLLGSTKTVNEGLHDRELSRKGIEIIKPGSVEQEFISGCITRIINNETLSTDASRIAAIMDSLKKKGAEGIILGCTDLPLLIDSENSDVPLLNTLTILEDSAVEILGS